MFEKRDDRRVGSCVLKSPIVEATARCVKSILRIAGKWSWRRIAGLAFTVSHVRMATIAPITIAAAMTEIAATKKDPHCTQMEKDLP